MNSHQPKIAVIGKGLVGTATARMLVEAGQDVVLIGPDEPVGQEQKQQTQVYASHYDQARVQRLLGFDDNWTEYHLQSLAQYADLEDRSGIRFYNPVGCLYVCPDGMDEYLHYAEAAAARLGVEHEWFQGGASLDARFQDFSFAEESVGYYEPEGGYLNPRKLLAANYKLFLDAGGQHIAQVVNGIEPDGQAYRLQLSHGQYLIVDKVVVAAGSFANFNELTPRPLPLRVKGEVVVLAEVPEAFALAKSQMPALLYEIVRHELDGIYMLPPVQYPDGRYYAKIGMNMTEDVYFSTLAEAQYWFRQADSERLLPKLKEAFLDFYPSLPALSWHTERCIISRTPEKKPIIQNLDGKGWYAAVTCNGYSAMSALAFGQMTTQMVLND